jgi:Queuosine biosynthesis protein QueC
MRRYAIVVNDCVAPPVPGLLHIRSRDTEYGTRNFTLRFDEIAEGLPELLTDRHMDWLEILGHLFAVDIACERGAGDVEWNRSISAWLPVRDPTFWRAHRATIEAIWSDLTDDELNLHFEEAQDPAPPPRMSTAPFPDHDGVALISGGQDSFTGALDLLDSNLRPLLLSHTASGATNTAQKAVEAFLRERYGADLTRLKLTARKTADQDFPGMEPSQRSRTFLFVGAASVLAAIGGSGRVWLNENGIMALHLPLTPARTGSFSTHTASPPILERIGQLATEVLGSPLEVSNRLVAMTKPEVVARAIELGGSDKMQDTVSCWQIGRTREHCGICAPCLLRRISCEQNGIPDVPYTDDVFDDPKSLDDRRARDNLTHLISFIADLQELPDVDLEYEYPELLSGQPALTLSDAIELHRRWAEQAANILFSHPVPTSLR